jgi:peptide/nickel transport system substrate-binding protein
MIGFLAESWDISPDGLTYTFNIRKGVRWHNKAPMNGRELTAKDIEYNFHRNMGMGKFTEPSASRGSLADLGIASIEATDDMTVVFKLSRPHYQGFQFIMDWYNTWIQPPEVIEEHGSIDNWQDLVGTGPYMLVDWVRGTSTTYEKNPDYWGFDEKFPQNRLPYIDTLTTLVILEVPTILAALRSGQVDHIGEPGASQLKAVDEADSLRRTNPELVMHTFFQRSNTAIRLDTTKPPFDDIRVRQAMQRALDLKTINDSYYKGTAKWQPQGVIGEALSGYTPFDQWPERLKQSYAYDPEGAKKLLKEAGYPNGFKTVLNHFGEFDVSYTELAAEYFRAIGVDVEIRLLDRATFIPLVTEGTMEGIAMTVQGWNIPWGAAGALRFRMHSTSDWNLHKFKDAEVDAKIEAAEAAATMEEQLRLASELDMKLIEQHWYVWGPKAGKFMAVQPWVKGYNGEVHLGPQNRLPIFARLWIDK